MSGSEKPGPPRSGQDIDEVVADTPVGDIQTEPISGGQELIPLQLFENVTLRGHRTPEEVRRGRTVQRFKVRTLNHTGARAGADTWAL